MAELVRVTLEEGLERPKPKALGMFESKEETDLGRQAGEMKFEPRGWR